MQRSWKRTAHVPGRSMAYADRPLATPWHPFYELGVPSRV